MIIISDIDGTICHHITGYDANSHPGWEEYTKSEPIVSTLTLLTGFAQIGYDLVFMTWRPEVIRRLTEGWLSKYFTQFGLLMRKNEADSRTGAMVKKELFWQAQINPADVYFVLEDDAACVEMWRSIKFDVLQVHAEVWK